MDTARTFRPETILLLERVAEHSEAQRILGLFPSANILDDYDCAILLQGLKRIFGSLKFDHLLLQLCEGFLGKLL